LSGWKAANQIGTLAAACAEAGDYSAAVKWQEQALLLYGTENDKSNGRARLTLYQAKQPYHEEPAAQ